MIISTLLSSSSSLDLRLPPPVHSLHFGTEALRWHYAVTATLMGVNELFGVVWLPHQPSHGFDDLSTPVFDTASGIVIPFNILESM